MSDTQAGLSDKAAQAIAVYFNVTPEEVRGIYNACLLQAAQPAEEPLDWDHIIRSFEGPIFELLCNVLGEPLEASPRFVDTRRSPRLAQTIVARLLHAFWLADRGSPAAQPAEGIERDAKTRELLTELFAADKAYGCGFYDSVRWWRAYDDLRAIAANGGLPNE